MRRSGDRLVGLDAALNEVELPATRARRLRSLVEAVLAPYDRSAALLFYGAIGLVVMLLFEWVGSMIVLDQAAADALYGSTKSLATVGPNPAVDDGPKWFKVTIVASMLLTLLSAACFTGGLINRLVDSRLTGLIGRRAVPRRDHVVVVGLGQVGLRLCLLLRECGVPVVAVDTEAEGENVGFARRVKLPVVIGRGANPDVLRRLSLARARSLARGHAGRPAQHRGGGRRARRRRRPARRAARRRRRRSPTRRARWSGSGTCSTCTGSARPTSPGWRSARTPRRSRSATAARSSRWRDGEWEEFPLEIAR